MESSGIAEQLRAVERGEAAPYIYFPPTPWWYAPAVGAWSAAVIGTFTWWRVNGALFVGSLVLLGALEALLIRWLRRRHGAFPVLGRGRPPVELVSVMRGFAAGLAAVTAIVALAWWLAGVPAAAVAAFCAVTAGLAVYERRYARAAARARERLR